MSRKRELIVATIVLSVVVIAVAAPTVSAQKAEKMKRQTYTAQAVTMGTSNPPILPAGRTARVDVNITRWSTEEERNALLGILVEEGQAGLIKALRKQKETGWLRVTGPTNEGGMAAMPSERFRYAREIVNEDGSRRLVLALDRPISMYESIYRPRWRDYDMTLVVIDLDAEGNGMGQLAIGVQLGFKPETRTLVIENFGTEPVRLNNIRQMK